MHLLPAIVIALLGVGSYSGEGDMATWQFCRRVIKAGHKKREGPIHWHSKCV